jgi:hypothetical protein
MTAALADGLAGGEMDSCLRITTCLSLTALAFGFVVNAAPAAAESPAQYCQRVVNDDALQTPPDSLMPVVRKLFAVGEGYPREATRYRCAEGNVMVCIVGANLPCGKADTRTDLPAATEWCQTNRDSDFIPMAVTGHDTMYNWRCANGIATISGKAGEIDDRGFFVDYWKKLK